MAVLQAQDHDRHGRGGAGGSASLAPGWMLVPSSKMRMGGGNGMRSKIWGKEESSGLPGPSSPPGFSPWKVLFQDHSLSSASKGNE